MTGPVPGPPVTAALGGVEPLPHRQVVLRVVVVLVVLVLGLLVRFSGVLHKADPALPPLDGAAQVMPGVLRAGPASETELMLMRDSFHVSGVVAIGDVTVEERAVTKALGMQLMTIEIADVDAPSAQHVVELVRFVRSNTENGHGAVYLHDGDGSGPVLVTAAMVQLVEGMPLADVLARLTPQERAALGPAQNQALQDAAAALTGDGLPTGPYVALREVAR
ncbi:MAG TPA: hypothetical protein VIY28_02820 [Pseudonocardiaceae bacterium]